MKNVTFPVPTSFLGHFTKEVARLNKKANKLSCDEITFTMSEPRLEEQTIRTEHQGFGIEREKKVIKVEVVDITFNPVTLGVLDYNLIGLTKKEEGMDILHNFTEGKIDLSEERGTCACDHCGHNRKRHTVYFVAKKDETDFIRVGSTCVQDFFPKSVENALGKFRFFEELDQFIALYEGGEGFEGMGTAANSFTVKEIMEATCAFAHNKGYVSSRKSSESDLVATKDLVGSFFEKKSDFNFDVTDKDREKAQEILEWFNSNEESSDYFDNCREIVSKGFCGHRYLGYIVGLYGAWNYFTQKQEAKKAIVSKHVGEIGKRQTFIGVIKSITTYHSDYAYDNVGYLTTVIDEKGNQIKYFNLIKPKNHDWSDFDELEGLKVQFDAGVKKHDEFNDIPQTQITRVTKVSVLEVPTMA